MTTRNTPPRHWTNDTALFVADEIGKLQLGARKLSEACEVIRSVSLEGYSTTSWTVLEDELRLLYREIGDWQARLDEWKRTHAHD